MKPKKLNYLKTFLLGFGFFGVSVIWSVYNAFVPLFLDERFGLQAGFISFIMVLDNIAALIIQPPLLFDLTSSFDAAVRPVHHRNVGLPAAEPVDDFWKKVYETVGVQDVEVTVKSFVDAQHIRAYFNSHAFAINPAKGLLRRWFERFESLVCDLEFQSGPCQDVQHQVFLHQAVLSALIATSLDPRRVRILPPEYSYPYNMHQSVPAERRAQALNDLVFIAYEDRALDPSVVDDIGIHEPLRSWLSIHGNQI